MLTEEQRERYRRNMVIDEIGDEGQRKLVQSRVLIVGAGGLGSPVLMYLAAAGVGTLGLIDSDRVDRSNLQRQIAHTTADIGREKTASAAQSINALNPDICVHRHQLRLDATNARRLIREYDVVVDATDTFGARYTLSDACVIEDRPLVHGAVMRFDGEAAVLCLPDCPCYRCLFPRPPRPGSVPTPGQAGVLGPVPGLIGCLQAVETIKLLLGLGDSLRGRLLLYDGLRAGFHEVRIKRNPDCWCERTREIDPQDPLYQY